MSKYQYCIVFDSETGRCEEDAIYTKEGEFGPLCESFYDEYSI